MTVETIAPTIAAQAAATPAPAPAAATTPPAPAVAPAVAAPATAPAAAPAATAPANPAAAPTTITGAAAVAPPLAGPVAFKAPDGFGLTATASTKLGEAFASAGIDGAAAQKLVDHLAGAGGLAALTGAAPSTDRAAWRAESSKAFSPADLGCVQRALAQFGDPGLVAHLEQTGLGDHPALIRLLVAAGRSVSEDRIAGARPGAAASTEEERLRQRYPSMFGTK